MVLTEGERLLWGEGPAANLRWHVSQEGRYGQRGGVRDVCA
jgi:hypothetical protein